jgi:hypothetical protein
MDEVLDEAFEWSEAVADTYDQLDRAGLPGRLALALASPHLDSCRACQDRIVRIVMLLEDLGVSASLGECDVVEYYERECG